MAGQTYKFRTLEELPEFTEALSQIAEARHTDEALFILTWAITKGAEDFRPVRGFQNLRVGKSAPYQREDVFIPSLKVWFSIIDDDRVLLRMITRADEVEFFGSEEE
ncbi:MAG TPA: hypothetical protein VN937_01810 [Blastocatellia bacterium]|nr:hypothetical protein [Blastocatellia bacterium]